ncbi:MAG TPA: DUF2802 domain-containing protein [Steroidobacteraceae bacterium]|jgi:hypothetical protein|nr:DUF2802 domain-containing protein [Steroidobacteraceae bacterium]
MNIDISTVLELAGAMLGLPSLVAAVFAVRSVRSLQARFLDAEASLMAVRRELEIVASISTKAGRRVKRIEQDYSGVSERVDQVELRGAAQNFDQAIESARRGADPGKLAQQFGLSRSEADLVTRLHGRKKSA